LQNNFMDTFCEIRALPKPLAFMELFDIRNPGLNPLKTSDLSPGVNTEPQFEKLEPETRPSEPCKGVQGYPAHKKTPLPRTLQ
jgi:hypothetical protein